MNLQRVFLRGCVDPPRIEVQKHLVTRRYLLFAQPFVLSYRCLIRMQKYPTVFGINFASEASSLIPLVNLIDDLLLFSWFDSAIRTVARRSVLTD